MVRPARTAGHQRLAAARSSVRRSGENGPIGYFSTNVVPAGTVTCHTDFRLYGVALSAEEVAALHGGTFERWE